LIIGGIDEAGRGPAIGPMVMSLVIMDEEDVYGLVSMGARDSKAMTPKLRRRVYSFILERCLELLVRVVSPEEIDNAVMGRGLANLNELEAYVAAEMISMAKGLGRTGKIYMDSPDPKPERYLSAVKRFLEVKGVSLRSTLVAENHAELKFPVVALASIVSKVVRDDIVEKLRKEYGDFGSGYPSDPKTKEFIREWLGKRGESPPIARKSWRSWRVIPS